MDIEHNKAGKTINISYHGEQQYDTSYEPALEKMNKAHRNPAV